jgi:hypothetical protein
MIEVDQPGLALVALLDGTRDIAAIHRELLERGFVAQEGQALTLESVEQNVAKMGQAALLMA